MKKKSISEPALGSCVCVLTKSDFNDAVVRTLCVQLFRRR